MAKLTFTWTSRGEEAKPSKTDVANLKEANFVFQLDFLQDVIAEAQNLYEETLLASREYYEMKRLEKQNATAATH